MTTIRYPIHPVLLVDDEEPVLKSYKLGLLYNGINNFICTHKSTEVLSVLKDYQVSVIVLDLMMPHLSGQELLGAVKEKYPDIPVIIVTGKKDLNTAVECMKKGAMDYMVKPVDTHRLVNSIKLALKLSSLTEEVTRLSNNLFSIKDNDFSYYGNIITRSPKMHLIFRYIDAIAVSPEPVLITGESGVGKELIARAIHTYGKKEGPFVPVNIAGLDDTVFSDTLFGHKKGSYTGADNERKGLVDRASGGTLFLDEIGDLRPESQLKLLRLIEENEYYPLGSDLPELSKARIITATNVPVDTLKNKSSFRKDLFYRLHIHHIHIPPLRERKEDIPLLIEHFAAEAGEKLHKKVPEIPAHIFTSLGVYNFPGNVRELRSITFNMLALPGDHFTLPEEIKKYTKKKPSTTGNDSFIGKEILSHLEILPTLKEINLMLIEESLKRTNGSQVKAAQLLGITPQALSKRLQKKKK